MPKITPQSASMWPDQPNFESPSWASRACPKSTQIGQDSLLDIFLPKVAPESSEIPSKRRLFFFFDFSSFLGRFFKGFSLSGPIFHQGLPKGLTEKAKLERGQRFSPQASEIIHLQSTHMHYVLIPIYLNIYLSIYLAIFIY